jgi:hypothetical protein
MRRNAGLATSSDHELRVASVVPEKIVPNGPNAEWSAVIGMESQNENVADERPVPSMFVPNVTSVFLAVITDHTPRKRTMRSLFAV